MEIASKNEGKSLKNASFRVMNSKKKLPPPLANQTPTALYSTHKNEKFVKRFKGRISIYIYAGYYGIYICMYSPRKSFNFHIYLDEN